MRISVPTIPVLLTPSNAPQVPRARAIERLSEFLGGGTGPTTVLTGAGVSVDSGVRAYRGKDGRYMNPNYECVHIYVIIVDILITIPDLSLYVLQTPLFRPSSLTSYLSITN
jgi:NAD+-dependent protein deacetylase sirtuin 4